MQDAQIALLLDLILDLKKDQSEIKEMTIENTVSLKEHMRRTEIAEKRLELIEDDRKLVRWILKFAGWSFGIASTMAGLIYTIIQILHYKFS